MKKLIVLATLAALPAVASADVVLSGNLGVAVSNTQTGEAGSTNNMSRNAGEIRFSGNEDLGNGIKAIWQVANRIDPAGDESGAQTQWANRDTFVGLTGNFGTLRFGNVSNPANSGFTGAADQTWQVGLGSGSQKKGQARHKHSIRYNSPTVAGFDFALSHQLKEGTGNTSTYSTDYGVKYKSDLFSAQLSVTSKKNAAFTAKDATAPTVTNKSENTAEFNVSSSFDKLTVVAAYAQAKLLDKTGQQKKTSGYGVSATYGLGKVTPVVGFWKEKDSKTNGVASNDDSLAFALGVDYALSKRTNTGIELLRQSETTLNSKDDQRTVAFYLFHKF